MMSYRFARRSFLASIGGAAGLEILLGNLEASAEGAALPRRFLMMNWPCGVMKYAFNPANPGANWTASTTFGQPGYVIAPFDTPELKPITIFLQGMGMNGLNCPGGGAHEAGTPFATTGASGPGTRSNGGETDDGCAGGPSWDQIFLKHAPELSKKDASGTIIGKGFFNSICDKRIDSNETSTRCLSYGYTKVSIQSSNPGGMIQENQPLLPELSPLNAYTSLFSGVVPGGSMTNDEALRLLKQKRSVLDHSLRELSRMSTLAPAAERVKIEAHAQIIRQMEAELTSQIDNPPTTGGCTLPMMPPSSLKGGEGNAPYAAESTKSDDGPVHEQVGMAHASILRAAFACDLIRVGTFEWSPGTNHVSFKGCNPEEPDKIYMHHPLSHQALNSAFMSGAQPGSAGNITGGQRNVWNAMVGVQRWYFERTATFLKEWVATPDPLASDGSSLMDRTIVSMISEVGNPSHDRNGAGAVIIGGAKLGMIGGQFKTVTGNHNQLWVTIAQAFLGADWQSILASEAYYKTGVNPIAGLWTAPA